MMVSTFGTRGYQELVVRALTEFNKWHSSEAVAELVKLEDHSIVVELSGSFRRSCGIYDYFDDLKLELEKVVRKTLEITKVDNGSDERYVITYKIGSERLKLTGYREKLTLAGSGAEQKPSRKK